MATKSTNLTKEHYQKLRMLSCEELWSREVPAFDAASAAERMERVSVIRAVGVVFSESGTPEQKHLARQWLRSLLQDSQEKIRRYAMTALPKIGTDTTEEKELLDLLEKTESDREKKALGQTLEKIGGTETLARTKSGELGDLHRTVQKVQANIARQEAPGAMRMDTFLEYDSRLRIHLRCRKGLERILQMEFEAHPGAGKNFRMVRSEPGLVAIDAMDSFRLMDVFSLRGFATAGVVLGTADAPQDEIDALAQMIASPLAARVFQTFTNGPVRYRLEFSTRGHQRSLIRKITDRVFELNPALINDSRSALWQIDIHQKGRRLWAELTPRLRPDPRFSYRLQDIPAASHPPLAACLAFLANASKDEIVWDPFCGSGLELIECAKLGQGKYIIGTDRSDDAIAITKANFAAALPNYGRVTFETCDFRDYSDVDGLSEGGVSVIISNPPMGRRIPIANLRGLIVDFLEVAEEALAPGGRLVFANPLPVSPRGNRLKLEFQQRVDLGGFDVHVERYLRR